MGHERSEPWPRGGTTPWFQHGPIRGGLLAEKKWRANSLQNARRLLCNLLASCEKEEADVS